MVTNYQWSQLTMKMDCVMFVGLPKFDNMYYLSHLSLSLSLSEYLCSVLSFFFPWFVRLLSFSPHLQFLLSTLNRSLCCFLSSPSPKPNSKSGTFNMFPFLIALPSLIWSIHVLYLFVFQVNYFALYCLFFFVVDIYCSLDLRLWLYWVQSSCLSITAFSSACSELFLNCVILFCMLAFELGFMCFFPFSFWHFQSFSEI